jgi:hypothetical protein
MIRGNIAIPDKDPKTWRSRGRTTSPTRVLGRDIGAIMRKKGGPKPAPSSWV